MVQNPEYPFPSLKNPNAFFKAWALMPETLIDLLPKSNPDTQLSDTAFEVMASCWKLDPEERPPMREALSRYLTAHPDSGYR